MIEDKEILELIKVKPGGNLHHREGQSLKSKSPLVFLDLVIITEILLLLRIIRRIFNFVLTDFTRRRVAKTKSERTIEKESVIGH